jgi:hypothetical protein
VAGALLFVRRTHRDLQADQTTFLFELKPVSKSVWLYLSVHAPEDRERRRTIQDWKMQRNRTNVGGEDRTRDEKGSIMQHSKLYPMRAMANASSEGEGQ